MQQVFWGRLTPNGWAISSQFYVLIWTTQGLLKRFAQGSGWWMGAVVDAVSSDPQTSPGWSHSTSCALRVNGGTTRPRRWWHPQNLHRITEKINVVETILYSRNVTPFIFFAFLFLVALSKKMLTCSFESIQFCKVISSSKWKTEKK